MSSKIKSLIIFVLLIVNILNLCSCKITSTIIEFDYNDEIGLDPNTQFDNKDFDKYKVDEILFLPVVDTYFKSLEENFDYGLLQSLFIKRKIM